MERGAQILRQKGLSKVATLEDRENNQGAVAIAREGNTAALVQLKAETDFSAKAEDFVELVQRMADAVLADGEAGIDALKDQVDSLKIVKKENIEVGTVARFEAAPGALDAYLHIQDGRGTSGVLIEISADEAGARDRPPRRVRQADRPRSGRDRSRSWSRRPEHRRSSPARRASPNGRSQRSSTAANSWYAERASPSRVCSVKETVNNVSVTPASCGSAKPSARQLSHRRTNRGDNR
jgi:elongation factor Ts